MMAGVVAEEAVEEEEEMAEAEVVEADSQGTHEGAKARRNPAGTTKKEIAKEATPATLLTLKRKYETCSNDLLLLQQ